MPALATESKAGGRHGESTPLQVNRLHPVFAAELIGADLALPPDGRLVDLVEQAMREFGILVIRDQGHVGDDEHIRFSQAFGPLELPPSFGKPPTRFRAELYDASNLDESGEIAPADSLRHKFSKGNELFHSDSSFNEKPTKWSLLFCHIPAVERGNTEFVDGRAVYAALPDAMKARLEDLTAEHNFWVSRERGGYPQPDAVKAFKPAVQQVIKTSESGDKTLFVGAHLHCFAGMDEAESETLLYELLDFASQPQFVYAHQWRKGDLVIWDNRCTLHRAMPFDYLNHKRDLRRTTISDPRLVQAASEIAAATA
jgi:alpha-ketoglutarate-dependent 2,4-dichlorophenoxyacetate dioxygenase